MTDLFLVRFYTPDLISYIYIPYNLLLCSLLIPFNTFIPMSTTSVVHGYLIVLEETQKKPIKPKAQLNPIKPTGVGFFFKKNRFFQPRLYRKSLSFR